MTLNHVRKRLLPAVLAAGYALTMAAGCSWTEGPGTTAPGEDPTGTSTAPASTEPGETTAPGISLNGVEQLTHPEAFLELGPDSALPASWLQGFATAESDEQDLLGPLLEFSEKSFVTLAAGWDEANLLLSPLSLYVDLAMLGEGTDGETREEIARALAGEDYVDPGLSGGRPDDQPEFIEDNRQAIQNLIEGMNMSREKFTMRAGQSIWYRPDIPIREDYLDLLENTYYTEAFKADFAGEPENVQDAINRWVYDKTAGLLGDDLPMQIQPTNVMYLLQTLYFKDSWFWPFFEENTQDAAFRLEDGSTKTAPFMKQSIIEAWGYKGAGYQAAEMETEQGFSFRILLPDDVLTLNEALELDGFFETAFSAHASGITNTASGWTPNWQVNWQMPRFDVTSTLDLLDLLGSLGMTSVMGPDADFSRAADVSPGSWYLSTASQQVRVKVDEKGVEAAAVTILGVDESAPMIEGILDMTLDRPFFFTISTPAGLPLFMGWVGDISG